VALLKIPENGRASVRYTIEANILATILMTTIVIFIITSRPALLRLSVEKAKHKHKHIVILKNT